MDTLKLILKYQENGDITLGIIYVVLVYFMKFDKKKHAKGLLCVIRNLIVNIKMHYNQWLNTHQWLIKYIVKLFISGQERWPV